MFKSISRISGALLSGLLLLACQEKKADPAASPRSDSSGTMASPQANQGQGEAELDRAWQQAVAEFNADSLVDASHPISTDTLLLLLNRIKSDSLVRDSAFAGDGCSGDSSRLLRYGDGATWTLREGSRSFVEVQGKALERLGLHSPPTLADWAARFGKAAKIQGPLHYYLSDQPDSTQLPYFQNRWKVLIYAPENQIQKITFEENFDDC